MPIRPTARKDIRKHLPYVHIDSSPADLLWAWSELKIEPSGVVAFFSIAISALSEVFIISETRRSNIQNRNEIKLRKIPRSETKKENFVPCCKPMPMPVATNPEIAKKKLNTVMRCCACSSKYLQAWSSERSSFALSFISILCLFWFSGSEKLMMCLSIG